MMDIFKMWSHLAIKKSYVLHALYGCFSLDKVKNWKLKRMQYCEQG